MALGAGHYSHRHQYLDMGSRSAVGLTMLFATLLVVYLKAIEGRRLEERSGSRYQERKQRTPFFMLHLYKEADYYERIYQTIQCQGD